MDREARIRERVVREADQLFFTLGFGQATMDELSRRLGMSKKTLYRFFPSKEELLRAVMKQIVSEVEVGTDAIFDDETLEFTEKLERLFSFIGTYIVRLRQPVLDDIQRNARDVWDEFDNWRQRRVLGKFGQLIREGIAKGYIRKDLDPELLAIIHSTVVRRVMSPEVLTQLPLTATQAFRTIIAVFFEGILTAEARSSYRRTLSATVDPSGMEKGRD